MTSICHQLQDPYWTPLDRCPQACTIVVAAGTLATLGLFILPQRRRRAKRELAEAVDGMRRQLMERLTAEFNSEAELCRARIHDTVAPYDRFVRTERSLLEERLRELAELSAKVRVMQARVDDLLSGTAG